MSYHISLNNQDTFALYRLPKAKDHFLVKQKNNSYEPLTAAAFQEEGFAFHPFKASEKHPAIFIKKEICIANARITFQSLHTKKLPILRKEDYLSRVDRFIEATKQGFQKLVFSRIKLINVEAGNLFYLFEALKAAHPTAFVYLVNIKGIGCWIGATPERLFSQNGKAETMALAGTQRDLGIPIENVVWAEKEIEEQAIVERYFKNILQQRQISFTQSVPHTVKAGNILHLCTNFSFDPQGRIYDLIAALHPSPAVCGMPKQAARQFILQQEPHSRAYYCGFLGPVNIHEKTNLFVNLRCMQVFEQQFALYVGGGILPDSDPEKEWQETEMKARTLSNVIEKVYLSEQFVSY